MSKGYGHGPYFGENDPIKFEEPTMPTDLDKFANDTAPDFDGTPSVASWSDIFSVDELAAVLEVHAAKAAKAGNYGAATDIGFAVAALLELSERCDV